MTAKRENKSRRGIELFDNPWLDRLSRVHPVAPALFWGPVVAGFLAAAFYLGVHWTEILWLAPAGYVAWALAEYATHRWFFHFTPRRRWLKRLFYYVHEHHHRYQEWDRLLAPPLMAFGLFAVFLGIFYVAVGLTLGLGPMCAMFAGFGVGYLIYDYTHFYVHFARPRTRLGRALRRRHLEHHFAYPECWYGISCPWVDYLFRTHRPRSRSKGQPTGAWRRLSRWDEDDLPPKVREYERQTREN